MPSSPSTVRARWTTSPANIRRKHGSEAPDYLYPTLQGILEETYGIIIYQEQVMQIAQELAGYSLGGADLLRRAMGKKIAEEMEKQRKIFVDGAVQRGVPDKKASEIFDLVAKFASYGFNKSHAAAYALVAYHTAYLKANHPTEFIAASMTLDMNKHRQAERVQTGAEPPEDRFAPTGRQRLRRRLHRRAGRGDFLGALRPGGGEERRCRGGALDRR